MLAQLEMAECIDGGCWMGMVSGGGAAFRRFLFHGTFGVWGGGVVVWGGVRGGWKGGGGGEGGIVGGVALVEHPAG